MSKNEKLQITWNAFSESFAPIGAMFEGKTAVYSFKQKFGVRRGDFFFFPARHGTARGGAGRKRRKKRITPRLRVFFLRRLGYFLMNVWVCSVTRLGLLIGRGEVNVTSSTEMEIPWKQGLTDLTKSNILDDVLHQYTALAQEFPEKLDGDIPDGYVHFY